MPSYKIGFANASKNRKQKSQKSKSLNSKAFYAQLLSACADTVWWYGWGIQEIDDLSVDDFVVFQQEASRQIKAGYRKGL